MSLAGVGGVEEPWARGRVGDRRQTERAAKWKLEQAGVLEAEVGVGVVKVFRGGGMFRIKAAYLHVAKESTRRDRC